MLYIQLSIDFSSEVSVEECCFGRSKDLSLFQQNWVIRFLLMICIKKLFKIQICSPYSGKIEF